MVSESAHLIRVTPFLHSRWLAPSITPVQYKYECAARVQTLFFFSLPRLTNYPRKQMQGPSQHLVHIHMVAVAKNESTVSTSIKFQYFVNKAPVTSEARKRPRMI